jgi:hypothetical protein
MIHPTFPYLGIFHVYNYSLEFYLRFWITSANQKGTPPASRRGKGKGTLNGGMYEGRLVTGRLAQCDNKVPELKP